MDSSGSRSRRTFLKESASAAAAAASLTIVPRHVLGQGPGPAERQGNIALVGAGGQGRTNLRSLFEQPDAQVIAVADPAGPSTSSGSTSRAWPGESPSASHVERHYEQVTPNYRCTGYVDFRRDATSARPRSMPCSARPPITPHASVVRTRDASPQARLLREAADPQHPRGPPGCAGGEGDRRGDADGKSGPLDDGMRETVELIQAGIIGTAREVHAWVPAGRWNPALSGRPPRRRSSPPA